ncbi:MAG: sugar phosphate isomerase/epimerase [Bacteroidales bacterium]
MKTNRRDFLRQSSLFAAGALVLPSLSAKGRLFPPASPMKPGLQIYSVRNQLRDGFEPVMKKVADIGYKYIEGYGLGTDGQFLGSIAPGHFKQVIADLGMELKATHCSYAEAKEAGKMVDAAAETGMEYLIIPYTPDNLRPNADGWKKVAENFNKIGEMCKSAGLKFGYHNHAFEFEPLDGIIPQELLVEATDPGLVCFEADLFWVTKGGYDPVKLLKKFPGRFPLLHVKESDEEGEETTIGDGIIDFKTIFETGRKDVVEYYFVEDERTEDPYMHIKDDYDYVSSAPFMN